MTTKHRDIRAALLLGASISILAAMPAFAEEEAAVDELVVTGRPIAESQAAALQVQKESDSLVSVIAADSVGRLPDQNIAFAIGRLPGVAIERDQGQARYVNLRGARINWTTLSFDGLSVISPEGRASRFDNIPSALASQIVVQKAVTPDMPGDTVAGNVNIITRSAFDAPGMRLNGKAALGYVAKGGGEEADVSLFFSDRYMDDKLGVVLQASKYHRNMVTDNWETDPWQTAGNGRDRRPGAETRRWAREFENKFYRLTRGNIGASMKLEYELSPDSRVFASSIYTEYQDEELRNNYIFRLDNGAVNTGTGPCPAVVAPQTTSGAFDICNGNTPDKGVVYGAQITSNFNSLETREYTWTNTLGGEHKFADWDVSWRLNYTQTEDGMDAPSRSNFASPSDIALRPTVEYDFTDDDHHIVNLYRTLLSSTGVRSRGVREGSIESFAVVPTGTAISTTDGGDPAFAYTAKMDVARDLDMFGSTLRFKAGALYSARTKKHEEKLYGATPAQLTAAGVNFNFDVMRNGKPPQGDDVYGYAYNYFSKSALDNFAGELLRRGVLTRQDTSGNYYRVQEEIASAYAMGTLDQSWGNIVFGARVERTKNSAEAYLAGTNRMIEVDNDYTLVFPSAHLNWDINDEMKFRVGVTTGASRPDFDELRPNFSFSDAALTVSGGNPDAEPERAIGVDAYFEWYLQPQGYLSIGAYYKDLSKVLFTQSGVFGSDILNSGGVDRSGYTFSTTRNGGDGYIVGLEASLSQSAEPYVTAMGLPEWMGGFGVQANVNLNDSEVRVPAVNGVPERKIPVPGSSDLVYNLSVYYERYGLSARLAYQFRTAWGQSVGEYQMLNGAVVPVTNGDIYWDDDEELDLSIRYQINDRFEWFFDAANLTDDPGRRYGDDPGHPIEHESFGRRYIMGVRFSF